MKQGIPVSTEQALRDLRIRLGTFEVPPQETDTGEQMATTTTPDIYHVKVVLRGEYLTQKDANDFVAKVTSQTNEDESHVSVAYVSRNQRPS